MSLSQTSLVLLFVYVFVFLQRINVTRSASSTSPSAAPRFAIEPQSSIVRPGTSLTLTCAVQPEAVGGVNIRWTVNGTYIEPSSSNRKRAGGITARDGMLKISSYNQIYDANVTSSHDGVYQCVAAGPAGTIVSTEATLETAYLGQFNATAAARSIEVTAISGNTAIITCPGLPVSRPAPMVEFEFKGMKIIPSGRYAVMPSGSLVIANASRSDTGSYQCVAYNPVVGSRVRSPQTLQLTVTDPPGGSNSRSAVAVTSSSSDMVSVVQGQNLTLECAARGVPAPEISWEKYGGHLPAGRHSIILGNLMIHGVQKFDAGTYLCKAANGVGQPQSKVISVDVLEPPMIETGPSDQNSSEGSTVVFKCRAHQVTPRVTTQWLFNGQPISTGQFVSIRDPTLTLSNLQRRQSGIYQCVVRNSLGMSYAAARLNVIETGGGGGGGGSAAGSAQGPAATGSGSASAGGASTSNKQNSETYGEEYDEEEEWDADEDDDDYYDETETFQPQGGAADPQRRPPAATKPSRRKNGGQGATSRAPDTNGANLASPSKPDVTRLSDTAVRLHWSVGASAGGGATGSTPISVFKVQYRDVTDRSSTSTVWSTIEDDIPATQKTYDVTRLRSGVTYRFRIVAIYSNNDNQHGPSSAKITLGSTSEQRARTAVAGPNIVEARALSVSEIFIGWQQQDTDQWPVEGFYIYFAPYDVNRLEYQRQVVLGSSVRHAVLSHLEPGTSYSIRVQSYSVAGTMSEYSNTVVKQTLATNVETPTEPGSPSQRKNFRSGSGFQGNGRMGDNKQQQDNEQAQQSYVPEGATRNASNDGQLLYVILGVVGGVIVIVVLASAVMCIWKRHQKQRNLAAEKEQNLNEHRAEQMTAFLAGSDVVGGSRCTDFKIKMNGSHVPGCGGGCGMSAAPGVQGNGRPGCHQEDVDPSCLQLQRPAGKKMAPELVLPPPPPLPPLPPALQAAAIYNQALHNGDRQGCSGVSQMNLQAPPGSMLPTNATSPIYSKLLDDSMSSYDDRLSQPPPQPTMSHHLAGVASTVPSVHFMTQPLPPVADHIPRSHEAHHPYWVLEQGPTSGQVPPTSVAHHQQMHVPVTGPSGAMSSTVGVVRGGGDNSDDSQVTRWRHLAANSMPPPGHTANASHALHDGAGVVRPSYVNYALRGGGRRPVDCDSLTTSVTSPADSCESLESSDVFSCAASAAVGAYSDDVDSIREGCESLPGAAGFDDTLRTEPDSSKPRGHGAVGAYGYAHPGDDSWKTLADRVSGGGYQIRPMPPGLYGGIPRSGPAAAEQALSDYPVSDVDDYR